MKAVHCKQQPYKSAPWHLHRSIKLKLCHGRWQSLRLTACLCNSFVCMFLSTAAGAGGGQAGCAGQGRGHAASRGTASPHAIPTAAAPRYAGCQQSGALGTLQEHSKASQRQRHSHIKSRKQLCVQATSQKMQRENSCKLVEKMNAHVAGELRCLKLLVNKNI